jgi:hypothetical protein
VRIVSDDPSGDAHLTTIRAATTAQPEVRPIGRYRLADALRELVAILPSLRAATTAQPEAGPAVPIRDRLLWSLRDIAALTGLSVRLLQSERAAGRMPAPDLRVGRRRALYRPETITTWLDALADGRGGRRP